MDYCLERLVDRIDSEERDKLKDLILSDRLSKLIRMRLEMQAPYVSRWPQALSIQVIELFSLFSPSNTKIKIINYFGQL